jgi:hypothetical protein
MKLDDETIAALVEHVEKNGYDTAKIIKRTIEAERFRCLQIATLPNMAVKDIVRAIKSGNWITPGNE